MTIENLDLFTHPSAPTFRAKIRPKNRDKMIAWFAKTPKQMVARFGASRAKGRNLTLDTMMGRAPIHGPTILAAAITMDRLTLVRKVADAPLSEAGFWAYAWRIVSEQDGLHVWRTDPAPETVEEIVEECAV